MKLKVMIITMGISRIVKPIVSNYNVVGIIDCAPRNKDIKEDNMIYRFLRFFYTIFKKEIQTLKSFTTDKNIPYYYMDNGSDKSLENWVKNINPDVIVVHSMSQLLKENIFGIPKYGTINLHPALLPNYRGPFPDFWMYYDGIKKGGVTVHYIDQGEDTGDIIYQEEYDIPIGMKSPDMLNKSVGEIGVKLLLKALNNIENLPKIPQPKKPPTQKARNIKETEHKDLINWQNWQIERIYHLLCGTELWLNAIEQPQGTNKGQRWIVEDYEKCNTSKYEVSKIYKEDSKYFVACKDGKIYLIVKFSLKNFILNMIR